jgi:thiol-disulfide isomerase/thioredoxin
MGIVTMFGLVLLLAVLAVATAFGLWRKKTDGQMKSIATLAPIPVADDDPEVDVLTPSAGEHGGERLTAEMLGSALGERATIVQFSTAFCQPCRATRRILDEVTTMITGTMHIEIDAEAHLDLVRQLDIRRTPTILVLDSSGIITKKAVGLPRKADVIAALGEVV